jgi:hypothetical protein
MRSDFPKRPMPFSLFNAATQSLLDEAFDEAWLTLGRGTGWSR